MMTKRVNIYPTRPIITVNPPIRSTVRGVTKPVADIRACILARAIVEEIMEDGNVVNLDLNNYDKDNASVQVQSVETPEPVYASYPSISTDTYTEKDYKTEMELPHIEEEVRPVEEENEATLQLSDAVTVSDSVEVTSATQDAEESVIPTTAEQQKRPQQYQKNNKNRKK